MWTPRSRALSLPEATQSAHPRIGTTVSAQASSRIRSAITGISPRRWGRTRWLTRFARSRRRCSPTARLSTFRSSSARLERFLQLAAQENIRVSRATAEAIDRLNRLPVPTVALVQGGCFGGGTGIAAACDIVIAADNALFSISEVRWGLTAAIIIPQLSDAISVRQLRRYALTGASGRVRPKRDPPSTPATVRPGLREPYGAACPG